jgi:hypothetical protein
LGDNLSSHISPAVSDACKANNIMFVCLAANSTDKLQPLDVSVFGPLKKAWRSVLTDYKLKHPEQSSLNKSDFPSMLSQLLDKSNPGQYLPAAFEKCGLQRIPHRSMDTDSEDMKELMNRSMGERLEQLRGVDGKEEKKKRGKKIRVPAGKSYRRRRPRMTWRRTRP